MRVAGDSALEWTAGCRSDVLAVYDGSELTLARCGHLRVGLNVTSRTHAVLLAFRTDRQRQQKGFWLAVEGHSFTVHLTILRQGEYVLPATVCLSVCLSVSNSNFTPELRRIIMKILPEIYLWTKKSSP